MLRATASAMEGCVLHRHPYVRATRTLADLTERVWAAPPGFFEHHAVANLFAFAADGLLLLPEELVTPDGMRFALVMVLGRGGRRALVARLPAGVAGAMRSGGFEAGARLPRRDAARELERAHLVAGLPGQEGAVRRFAARLRLEEAEAMARRAAGRKILAAWREAISDPSRGPCRARLLRELAEWPGVAPPGVAPPTTRIEG